MENLEQRVEKIEKRNLNVEMDKAWEISWARKALLFILTYLTIGVYLTVVEIDRPWLNAIVPAMAFMISTSTMSFLKRLWLKRMRRKQKYFKNHGQA